MANLKLAFASQDYDHTRALVDGRVKPRDITLSHAELPPLTIFQRMIQDRAFDFCEMGMTFYLRTLALDDPPFIAIPVFPARIFRHAAIYVNAASGIAAPQDLVGHKIGEHFFYGHDAGIWSKGILRDEYGVAADGFDYYFGGVDRPSGIIDWLPPRALPKIRGQHIAAARTLDTLLEAGEIDALFSARTPPPMLRGSTAIRRLFPDAKLREQDWFRRTGIFPMMHTVVIRKELYREHPWVARALYDAFKEAKRVAEKRYLDGDVNMHLSFMMPWLTFTRKRCARS